MSAPLNYRPVYLGLFLAQVLALSCNAFLDIHYGSFPAEVLVWSAVFAATLGVGWRQHGEINATGKRWMRRTALLGVLATLLFFLPTWGLPRAGVYLLGALMAAYNCITTARRHLHLSLLMSLVMVLYAATHFRADWTMLFYLVPYVTAVVFTLVAEQINRQADALRRQSLGHRIIGAQSAAIAAATAVILALGLLLYLVTPQDTWLSMTWRWGQPGGIGVESSDSPPGAGVGGTTSHADTGSSADPGKSGAGSGWPSPAEMREAAARPGMPAWQRKVINGAADLVDATASVTRPAMQRLGSLWDAFVDWLKKHREAVARTLIVLGILVLLYALYRLIREARVATWLRTRFDYLRLAVLGMHRADAHGARVLYEAMVRLFRLQDIERDGHENTREYLAEIQSYFRHLSSETGEMTRHYEDARYGGRTSAAQVARMRVLYRELFQRMD